MTGVFDVEVLNCAEKTSKANKPYFRVLLLQIGTYGAQTLEAISKKPVMPGKQSIEMDMSEYNGKLSAFIV